jgi:RNA polymerase sigma factor (sigma-70 family)
MGDPSRSTVGAASDTQLIALIRQGQQSAFDALAARYHARLLHFCWQILRSREDAEDVLQEVLAAAFRAIVADQRDIHVRPWLYRIAKNRCLSKLRNGGAASRLAQLDEDHADGANSPVEAIVSRQRFRDLVEDVQALPDTQRTALLLREIDGFGYQQIATAMDTTVPGVKSLLVRARAGLRDLATARDAGFLARESLASQRAEGALPRSAYQAVGYERARAAVG